jgi:microcystin degradation protein MlrC
LISNHTQALGLELFRRLGIEPTERKLVVTKSTSHFMAAFDPIARSAGTTEKIPYNGVKRPIWPSDEHTSPSLIA